MGKRCRDCSDRENWDRISKTLVKALKEKEEQLECLVKNRKILEDRIKTQDDRWVSATDNYEYQLSMMEKKTERLEMMRLVEIAKLNLLLGLKERDISKLKLEVSEHTKDDFRAWFDVLTQNKNKEICNSGDADDCKSLEVKIRKLKHDFEKLAFGKRCELSKLLRETGFAWSQFKHIESGFTDKLMSKDEEIKQLQSYNHEKDKIISKLMAKVAEMEEKTASEKHDGEKMSRIPQEVKPLRRSRRLNRCTNS